MWRKFLLRNEEARLLFVDRSKAWALALVRAESRGPGDMGEAMRRVARRIRIPFGRIWALHYRPPKDVPVSIYQSLALAYIAMCEEQVRHLRHEIEVTRAIAGADCSAVRAAETLVDTHDLPVAGIVAKAGRE